MSMIVRQYAELFELAWSGATGGRGEALRFDTRDEAERFLHGVLPDAVTVREARGLLAAGTAPFGTEMLDDGAVVGRLADLVVGGALEVLRTEDLLQGLLGRRDQPAPPEPPPSPEPPRPPSEDRPVYNLINVRSPPRIASGAETIQVAYEVVDEDAVITSGTYQILRESDGQVLKVGSLTGEQRTHGPHELPWDGAVSAHADLPDGYATIKHSPYTIKITVTGPEGDRAGQTRVAVELAEFTVRLAPRDSLRQDRDKAVWDRVRALPAGGPVELRLKSDLYAERSEEMEDNTAFTAYRTLWGDGPRIPIEVVTTVLSSTGQRVPARKALGRARVLWDATDPACSRAAYLSTSAAAFVTTATQYDAAAGRPASGDNAHVDRGGKRAAGQGGPALFAAADGDVADFPYAVRAGATRWWAGFSDIVASGEREGRSGAVFRPARTAGDNYAVTAYLDLDEALDTADAAPAGAFRTAPVGSFEVWREITLAEHYKKTAAITAALPAIDGYYGDAFIRVDNQIAAVQAFTRAQYDAAFAAALAAVPAGSVDDLLVRYSLPPGSQYDMPRPPASFGGRVLAFLEGLWRGIASVFGGGDLAPTTWVATFRPYGDFKDAAQAGQGWTDAQLATALANAGLETEKKYADLTRDYAFFVAEAMCKAKSTRDGVTVLQFDWTHSLEEAADIGRLNGNACFKTRSVTGFAIYNPRQDTTGHEIGHSMFLPHSPRLDPDDGSLINAGGGITPDSHDGADMNCLMSYARPRPGFCGLCVLRLRGWDKTQFTRTGPTVVK